MALLEGQRLTVVDVETTGWSANEGHEIIEIARVVVEDGAITETWSSLVRPNRPVPAESTRIHGITQEMLDQAPAPRDVAEAFHAACGERPLVFHNAAFDLSFVNAFLRGGERTPLYNPVIDTLGMSRGLFGSGSNTLTELVEKLGVPKEKAHRALNDARATANVLLALAPRWERERGVRSIDELAAASQDAIRVLALRG